MKFDHEEMKTIENFFKWVDEVLNNEKRFNIGDSYIEDKENGNITKLDIAYGAEFVEYIQILYFNEYYKKNLAKNI